MKSIRFTLLTLLTLLAFVVVACSPAATEAPAEPTDAPEVEATDAPAVEPTDAPAADATEAPTEEAPMEDMVEYSDAGLPMVDPLATTGDVISAGSSTVFPLAERMAERFQDEGYAGNITIDSIGSGAGLERFCVTGETDVANASRPIRGSEVESCRSIGREPIEFRVGTDALAVVVNPANDFATDVTVEELALIFSTATNWSDVRPEWPAEAILRFSPGTDSGTFDYFVEEVFDEDEAPILSAANIQFSEDDNVLVQGVEGSPYAIGYFGYAYYAAESDRLSILAIDGVEASAANVDNNTYPLARPLFIYSDAAIMAEKPQVAAYVNFFLTYVNEEVEEVGYFPASAAALQVARANWLAATGMLALPAVDPLAVTGDIISAGSSTVFPLAERMAERFNDEGYAGTITIDSIGSGAGYERFCVTGETDVANASRPIRQSEIDSCAAIGRLPIEFRVGTDALAVVVNPANDFATDVTVEELALIFSTATNWSDVRPEWPAEAILRFSPGTDSGTFDYFVEEVFDEDEAPILSAANIQFSEDDNVLVQGVEGSPYAIGYFGYAYYAAESDRLTILAIDGVEASAANVDNNTYPLARPLFIYSDATIMAEKPQVAAYINFFLTFVNEEVVEVGYFPAGTGAYNAALKNFLDATR